MTEEIKKLWTVPVFARKPYLNRKKYLMFEKKKRIDAFWHVAYRENLALC